MIRDKIYHYIIIITHYHFILSLYVEDVVSFREKGKVVLLGDFNARVGRSAQLDDVIGMFRENTCNASGN